MVYYARYHEPFGIKAILILHREEIPSYGYQSFMFLAAPPLCAFFMSYQMLCGRRSRGECRLECMLLLCALLVSNAVSAAAQLFSTMVIYVPLLINGETNDQVSQVALFVRVILELRFEANRNRLLSFRRYFVRWLFAQSLQWAEFSIGSRVRGISQGPLNLMTIEEDTLSKDWTENLENIRVVIYVPKHRIRKWSSFFVLRFSVCSGTLPNNAHNFVSAWYLVSAWITSTI